MIVENLKRRSINISGTVIEPNQKSHIDDDIFFAYSSDANVHADITSRKIIATKDIKKSSKKK